MGLPQERVKIFCATTGTGDSLSTTGNAVSRMFFTPNESGMLSGIYSYVIEQSDEFEIQTNQTYNHSAGTITRGTPAKSKVGGVAGTNKINLNGTEVVYFPLSGNVVGNEIQYEIQSALDELLPTLVQYDSEGHLPEADGRHLINLPQPFPRVWVNPGTDDGVNNDIGIFASQSGISITVKSSGYWQQVGQANWYEAPPGAGQ